MKFYNYFLFFFMLTFVASSCRKDIVNPACYSSNLSLHFNNVTYSYNKTGMLNYVTTDDTTGTSSGLGKHHMVFTYIDGRVSKIRREYDWGAFGIK